MSQRPKSPKAERWPWIWASVVMFLAVAVVALSLALHASSQSEQAYKKSAASSKQAAETVACVNRILGTRAPLTNNDTVADLAFLRAIVQVFNDPPGSKQQIIDGDALKRQAIATYHIKNADQLARLAHPLGAC